MELSITPYSQHPSANRQTRTDHSMNHCCSRPPCPCFVRSPTSSPTSSPPRRPCHSESRHCLTARIVLVRCALCSAKCCGTPSTTRSAAPCHVELRLVMSTTLEPPIPSRHPAVAYLRIGHESQLYYCAQCLAGNRQGQANRSPNLKKSHHQPLPLRASHFFLPTFGPAPVPVPARALQHIPNLTARDTKTSTPPPNYAAQRRAGFAPNWLSLRKPLKPLSPCPHPPSSTQWIDNLHLSNLQR